MYSIVTAVYGCPITQKWLDSENLYEEDIEHLITTYYTGVGDETPAFVGVELGSFDECNMYLSADRVVYSPSPHHISEANIKLAKLAKEIGNDAVKNLPQPGVYYIFSTS